MMMIRNISYTGEGLIPAPLHGPALRYTPLPPGDVTDIAVHHMTGWNPPADAPVDWEIRFLQGIDEYHRSSRGLDGIGYHIVPMASGRIYIVSRLDRYGAGVGYENNHLLHLALPGDYTSDLPAPGHLVAAVVAVRHLYGYLGRDVPTTPHLNWGGTTCPGARWREWVPQLREKAKGDDMALTNEQHAMLQTIHHMAKIVVPAEHKAIIGKLNHIHAHQEAQKARNEAIYNQLRSDIAAIGTVSGPSADAIAAKIADELAERLLA